MGSSGCETPRKSIRYWPRSSPRGQGCGRGCACGRSSRPVLADQVSFPENALVLGADHLLLLDELRELGPCEVMVSADAVHALDAIDPEVCYLGWDVVLTTDRPRQAIDDVFLRDDMEPSIEPVGDPGRGGRDHDRVG